MFIPFEIKTGSENMQIDSNLLEYAISVNLKEPVFRLYGWKPACVSLGRNQKSDFINQDLLASKGINLVRRLTGGRALLHDDEITYSFICPFSYLKNGQNVIQSYKEISQILIDGFAKLGIKLDFGGSAKHSRCEYCMLVSTGADLCFENRKLIGSAQIRKNGYILQHGSILYDYDLNMLKEIFNEKIDSASIISVKEINPDISKQDIINIFSNF